MRLGHLRGKGGFKPQYGIAQLGLQEASRISALNKNEAPLGQAGKGRGQRPCKIGVLGGGNHDPFIIA